MGVTSRLQSPLCLSTSLRSQMLPGVTRAGYSAPDFPRGQHRQTSPRGAVTSGNAVAMAVRRGGSVHRRLLSARIYGKFRIIHRRKPSLATMMLGAVSMDRPARPYIGSVEKTIITPACRSRFARPNSDWLPGQHIGPTRQQSVGRSPSWHNVAKMTDWPAHTSFKNDCDAILSTIT